MFAKNYIQYIFFYIKITFNIRKKTIIWVLDDIKGKLNVKKEKKCIK